MKHLILLLILLLPLPAHAGKPSVRLLSVMGNNVDISTFETGLDGWTANVQAARSSTLAHSGTWSVTMDSSATVIGQIQKTVNGRAGFVTFWYRCFGNLVSRVIVNGSTTLLGTTDGAWQAASVPISPGVQVVEFNTGQVGTSDLMVDDIRIPIQ